MRCDDFREAASARLDHEDLPAGVTGPGLDAHLEGCADCRAWADTASVLHRQVRVRPAASQPDRTEALLAAVPLSSRPRPVRQGVRYALLAVGLTQLLLALPALFLGTDLDAPVHVAREMGGFELALGVGLLSAAWRPRLATGLLPFAAALAGSLLVTAVVDVVRGQAVAATEAHHVLDLAGVALLWLLQTRPGQALRGRIDLVGA